MNATICEYHGRLLRLISTLVPSPYRGSPPQPLSFFARERALCATPSRSALKEHLRCLWALTTRAHPRYTPWSGLLELRFDAECDQLAGRLRGRLGVCADDVNRSLEGAGRFQIRDEIRQSRERRAPPVDDDIGSGLLQSCEPHHLRQCPADLIEHAYGSGLALPKLLDQHDALLQLRLALFELLHLLNDRLQPRRFLLGGRDLAVEVLGFRPDLRVPPPAESDGADQNQGADDRELLREAAERHLPLPAPVALAREQVDANHRSPAVRNARPTATAAVGMTSIALTRPRRPGSHEICRNGSKVCTLTPKRC